ncbi:cytochrome P450 monooxygenase-like protein, partial [Dinothrombium tinctorium]
MLLNSGDRNEEATNSSFTLFSIDSLTLFRLVAYSSLLLFLYKILAKKVLHLKRKIELIDRIPGPKSFSPLLGNIPFEVIKHVGSDFDKSKDMFY